MIKTKATVAMLLISASSVNAANYTPTACPVDCTGTNPVSAFDFWKKANSAGDPNGGALGGSINLPSNPDDPNAPADTNVSTSDYFGQLNDFEKWSAEQCGVSLNDDNSPDEVVVSQDCNSGKLLNRKNLTVINLHKPNGTPPPSLAVINKFFDEVTKPANQKKYYTSLYYQPEGPAVNQKACEESQPEIGDDNFNVFVKAKQCRSIYIPGTSKLIVQYGLRYGTSTETISEVSAGFTIFGSSFSPLEVKGTYTAPFAAAVTANHSVKSFGIQLVNENYKGVNGANKISVEKPYPITDISGGGQQTFFIGPIPVNVSAYAHGTLSAAGLAKVAPVWANGSVSQTVDSWVDADAHVNLVIAKAGVEGKITLLKDTLVAYGFMGVAPLPTNYNGQTFDMFYLSSQSDGIDDFHALSGNIKVYAKILRPKWFGWKWKKYSHNIFSWGGSHAKGYLFSNVTGPVDIRNLFK